MRIVIICNRSASGTDVDIAAEHEISDFNKFYRFKSIRYALNDYHLILYVYYNLVVRCRMQLTVQQIMIY